MITTTIDLGQMLIIGTLSAIGYLVRREINTIGKRLDKHEDSIFMLAGNVQRLLGSYSVMNNRRAGDDRDE